MHAQGLAVGDCAEFSKTITETDLVLFAGLTGDFNPCHMDEVQASAGRFGGRIVHGMLTSSLICTLLGMRIPGPGTLHLRQQLEFLGPVRPGDTVTARVEVLELMPRGRVRLRTCCRIQDGTLVVDGEALVVAPRRDA